MNQQTQSSQRVLPSLAFALVSLVAGSCTSPQPPAENSGPSTPDSSTAEIGKFWAWFASNHESILAEWLQGDAESRIADPSTQLGELDARFDALHAGLSWEIGPTDDDGAFLAVSPSADRDLVELVESIVDDAPHISDWAFRAYRPRKLWDRIVRFGERELDAKNWKYVTVSWRDPFALGVTFVVPQEIYRELEDPTLTAEFVLLSEIGERLSMKYFDDVELVPDGEEDPSYTDRLGPIEYLRPHVQQLIDNAFPDDPSASDDDGSPATTTRKSP
ncbi:MAG: hypothetical protein AAF517_22665 [Planctomycetota bacterium]